MRKIYIAPSNQTRNRYAYGNTNEAEQCEKIADYVASYLEDYDCAVKIGARSKTLQEKCVEAKDFGADVYLSIHTNAGGGKGTEVWYSPNKQDGSKAFAQAMYDAVAPVSLGKRSNGKDRGLKKSTSLIDCYRPAMPSCIVEIDFHDDEDIAKFIIENKEAFGKAMAEALVKYLSIDEKQDEPETFYRVQVGAYKNKANAEKMVEELRKHGFNGFIQVVTM